MTDGVALRQAESWLVLLGVPEIQRRCTEPKAVCPPWLWITRGVRLFFFLFSDITDLLL